MPAASVFVGTCVEINVTSMARNLIWRAEGELLRAAARDLGELAAELVPQAREMLSEKSQRGLERLRPRRERARGPRHLEERDGPRARDRRQLGDASTFVTRRRPRAALGR